MFTFKEKIHFIRNGNRKYLHVNVVPNTISFTSIDLVIDVHCKLFKDMIAKHLKSPFGKFDLIICATKKFDA